jgi:hypothetical protein
METPQPTLAAKPSNGKPFKLTMLIEFGGETYGDVDPAEFIRRGYVRFVSDWEANYPGVALAGQVFNITLKNDPASRS